MAASVVLLLTCTPLTGQERSVPLSPAGPREWVPFSADIHITFPKGTEAYGRRVQDEHGCTRDEGVHPDGSAMITLLNFQTEHTYRLFHGSWTSQPMRLNGRVHTPIQLRVSRRAEPIEGFDAFVYESTVRSPRGDYTEAVTVIPALNFFRAAFSIPSGERRSAVNIKVGPQPHDQFLPPPGAVVTEQPGFAGFMSFTGVALRLSFAGQPPIVAETTEEKAYAVKTPSGIPLTLVATVTDPAKNVVRIRLLANAAGSPGNVRGDVLDEVSVPLGGTGQTTRLGETLTIRVTRIGATSAK
jgi:hypothetical protein